MILDSYLCIFFYGVIAFVLFSLDLSTVDERIGRACGTCQFGITTTACMTGILSVEKNKS